MTARELAPAQRRLVERADELRAQCAELTELDDAALGGRLLRAISVHVDRAPAELTRWAGVALRFGQELAEQHPEISDPESWARAEGIRIVEKAEELPGGTLLMGQFYSRPPTIVLFQPTLRFADTAIELLGWRDDYPAHTVRATAICHELAHRLLTAEAARELKRRLGNRLVRAGRLSLNGHVLAADELVAHGFARARIAELKRSPVLLAAALNCAATVVSQMGRPPRTTDLLPANVLTRRSTRWAS